MRLTPVSQKDLIKRLSERSPIYAEGRFDASEDSEPALARYLRGSAHENFEAGQNFPGRMAPEWLGGYELRRLNAFQSWQSLPAFQLELDPAFQNLTQ